MHAQGNRIPLPTQVPLRSLNTRRTTCSGCGSYASPIDSFRAALAAAPPTGSDPTSRTQQCQQIARSYSTYAFSSFPGATSFYICNINESKDVVIPAVATAGADMPWHYCYRWHFHLLRTPSSPWYEFFQLEYYCSRDHLQNLHPAHLRPLLVRGLPAVSVIMVSPGDTVH